ncbi:MAG: hypothetical protein ACRC2O_16480, partial [Chitinophagaceae bacterium]
MKCTFRFLWFQLILIFSLFACNLQTDKKEPLANAPGLEEIRALAKEAYIYGYPVVDNYRFLYGRSMDTSDGMYLAEMNQWGHEA